MNLLNIRFLVGACVTHSFNQECTHVLVDEPMPVKEGLLDAIVAKKPCILSSWVKVRNVQDPNWPLSVLSGGFLIPLNVRVEVFQINL